jgi:hypothetical protein
MEKKMPWRNCWLFVTTIIMISFEKENLFLVHLQLLAVLNWAIILNVKSYTPHTHSHIMTKERNDAFSSSIYLTKFNNYFKIIFYPSELHKECETAWSITQWKKNKHWKWQITFVSSPDEQVRYVCNSGSNF